MTNRNSAAALPSIQDRPGTTEASLDLRFQRLAEALPQMVWTCEPDGPCDYLSPQWVAYTGISAVAQLGYGWLDQLHPDDVQKATARWASAAAKGDSFDTEFRIRRFDGVYRWFKTRATAVRDSQGRVVKWVGSNTDIQDLKDAQEEADRLNRDLEQHVAVATEDLREANSRLMTLTAQLQTAQRLTNVGSWALAIASGDVRWSPELFRVFGLDPASPPPRLSEQEALFTSESWSRLNGAMQQSLETGEGYELLLTALRNDGARRTTVAHAEPLRGPSGRVEQLVGTFQDITERERDSTRLRQLSERLQLATSAAGIGVWEWDVSTDALVWDETMHRLYDVDASRFSGLYAAWRSAVHPEDVNHAEGLLKEAVQGRAEFRTTFRIVRTDGIRYLRAESALFRDAAGTPVRMVGVNWDITEQREAENALRTSEARLQLALGNAQYGLWEWHVQSGEMKLDGRCAAIVGLGGDPVDAQFRDLLESSVHPDSRDELLAQLSAALEPDASLLDVDFKARRSDGSPLWVNARGRVFERTSAGHAVRMMGTIHEVTVRVQAEEQVRASLREKEVLLREIHHRVKNNLAVISSLLYLQTRTTTDSAVTAMLEDGRNRVQSMALVHEHLYRSDNLAQVNLAEYLRELAGTLHQGLSRGLVTITFDLSPVLVHVDRAVPCGLMLNELITNVLKHAFVGRAGGSVVIRLHDCGATCRLEVEDDGVGLPAVVPERSLGMRLIRMLCQQLDGQSELRDTGAGTIARVEFPR